MNIYIVLIKLLKTHIYFSAKAATPTCNHYFDSQIVRLSDDGTWLGKYIITKLERKKCVLDKALYKSSIIFKVARASGQLLNNIM